MARHRTRVRVSRSLRAVAVAVAAAGAVTALFEADLGRSILLSSSTVALLPPALYLVLAFILLRGAPLGRRLGWAVAACGVNAVLALLSGVTLSFTHPMSFEGAMRRALWAFAPGPFIHLVAAPLVLLGWRSRVVPLRTSGRSASTPRVTASRGPAPDWDSVMHVSTPTTWGAGPSPSAPVFDRPLPDHRSDPEPAAPVPAEPVAMVAVAAAPAAVAAAPLVAAPTPPKTPAPPVTPPLPKTPPQPKMPTQPMMPPAPKTPLPAVTPPPPRTPPAPRRPAPAPAGTVEISALAAIQAEVVSSPEIEATLVRVPFHRIADQLPPDVFVLPPERLAESVQEPHVIVIPCRFVLPQLGEGAIEVPWALIDEQFPELALAVPRAEVRRRFPGWVLSLPMDEVIPQIPASVFRVAAPVAQLFDIGQFPAPFAPEPPTPDPAPVVDAPMTELHAEPPDEAIPATLAHLPASIEPELEEEVATESEAVTFTDLLVAPAPPPLVPPAPTPAVEPPPAATPPAPRAVPAAPVTIGMGPKAFIDEECEALGRTLALDLAPLGALDWQARRVAGRPLVSFVPPTLARAPIDALAGSAVGLADRLAAWALEQVTIRTTRLVCVLTPLGTRGTLAATVRRGSAVAMLEMLSTRAARTTGGAPASAPVLALPAVPTTPARTDNGHHAVGEAARVLAAFGELAMSVAEAEGAAPSVYVFGGRDPAVLAGAARIVHEALVIGHDQEALGRLESVVLRRGRERVVLRPLRVHGATPAVLAAAGEVALVGRAQRAVAQAAALLEAR